jgi:hypothetical protein
MNENQSGPVKEDCSDDEYGKIRIGLFLQSPPDQGAEQQADKHPQPKAQDRFQSPRFLGQHSAKLLHPCRT